MRNVIGPIIVFALAAATAHCNDGCTGLNSPSVGELYAAEMAACLETTHTYEDLQKCRDDVDRKFGVCKRPDGLGPCDPIGTPGYPEGFRKAS